MPPKTVATSLDDALIKMIHRALQRERDETLRRRPGPRSRRPTCLVIGHAWTEDPTREGGTICMACQVVRWP